MDGGMAFDIGKQPNQLQTTYLLLVIFYTYNNSHNHNWSVNPSVDFLSILYMCMHVDGVSHWKFVANTEAMLVGRRHADFNVHGKKK